MKKPLSSIALLSKASRHPCSWSEHHGNKAEAEAEDRVCALLHGLPAGSRLCTDAAWYVVMHGSAPESSS